MYRLGPFAQQTFCLSQYQAARGPAVIKPAKPLQNSTVAQNDFTPDFASLG